MNGFNGFFLSDAIADEIVLVNHLIVANGMAAGTAGGRIGLLRESTAPATGPGTRRLAILRGNMFAELFADPANGASRLAVGSPAIGADNAFHSGAERMPAADLEGDLPPGARPAAGVDERP